jgi:hypothetical protein
MPFARLRTLRRWLLGLYLIAQAAGVFPVLCGHMLINCETTLGVAESHFANDNGRHEANHHDGVLDCRDRCCAIHSLTGLLPPIASLALIEREAAPVAPAASAALVSWHPSRLERPPKSYV